MKVAAPLDTPTQLIDWVCDPETQAELIPLIECSYLWDESGKWHRKNDSISQILYCHDMAGNYLESDRHYDLTPVFPAFRFTRWHLIDIFIYFSHHCITIPPISWINVAHRQGVRVYGTIIFEPNSYEFYSIFVHPDCQPRELDEVRFAELSDHVRREMRFEGWLLNFEIKFTESYVYERILTFIRTLKNLGSEVIWYDAVCKSGNLCWQNELTAENQSFLEVAKDGIFLNYNWTQEYLQQTQTRSRDASVSSRVFVGVDCFRRSRHGFSTEDDLEDILSLTLHRPDRPLSVALFAPGWPFEKCDLSSSSGDKLIAHHLIAEADERFWSPLANLISRIRGASQGCKALFRPTIPSIGGMLSKSLSCARKSEGTLFHSTCCTGQGAIGKDGELASSMCCQQIIPSCLDCSAEPFGTSPKPPNQLSVIQFACRDLKHGAGTCLLFRPLTQEPRTFFTELFSFPPESLLSHAAEFKLAFASADDDIDHFTSIKAQNDSSPVSLFLDTTSQPDNTAASARYILAPKSGRHINIIRLYF